MDAVKAMYILFNRLLIMMSLVRAQHGGAKKFRTRECAEFLLITSSLFTFH